MRVGRSTLTTEDFWEGSRGRGTRLLYGAGQDKGERDMTEWRSGRGLELME